MREQYLKKLPSTLVNVFKKAFSGKSKASAIKAKCLDCCNFYKDEIANCNAKNCPLWGYRPYQQRIK